MDGVYVVRWTEEVPTDGYPGCYDTESRMAIHPDWAVATRQAASHNGHAEFVPFGREVFEYLSLR